MHSRFEELGVEAAGFLRFLRQIFALKRKTLANNLRASGYDPAAVEAAFDRCAVDAQVRAEAVSLEAMACLFRALTLGPPKRLRASSLRRGVTIDWPEVAARASHSPVADAAGACDGAGGAD